MTLRCIVGRILQEPIEPAERDAAAELADALHDALASTTPASSKGENEPSRTGTPSFPTPRAPSP